MCSQEQQASNVQQVSNIPKQPMQEHPGLQYKLTPQPIVHDLPDDDNILIRYKPAGKLDSKIALITGGDSGIGRSVAAIFAMEGCAGIGIVYLEREEKDAQETKTRIEKQSKARVLLICKDVGFEKNVIDIVDQMVKEFGRIDILVNNSSEQHLCEKIENLSEA